MLIDIYIYIDWWMLFRYRQGLAGDCMYCFAGASLQVSTGGAELEHEHRQELFLVAFHVDAPFPRCSKGTTPSPGLSIYDL